MHYNWVVATQVFIMFTPKIAEDEPILTNIFQRRWNHQLDKCRKMCPMFILNQSLEWFEL